MFKINLKEYDVEFDDKFYSLGLDMYEYCDYNNNIHDVFSEIADDAVPIYTSDLMDSIELLQKDLYIDQTLSEENFDSLDKLIMYSYFNMAYDVLMDNSDSIMKKIALDYALSQNIEVVDEDYWEDLMDEVVTLDGKIDKIKELVDEFIEYMDY